MVADNSGLEMAPFLRNVSFHSVNLIEILQHDLVKASRIFQSAMDLVQKEIAQPVKPILSLPISKIEEAFRLMQTGKHIGKIVLEPTENDIVPVVPPTVKAIQFRADATYVLSGGSGGIGRSLAKWMVQQGAKNIVFLSRSGMNKPEMVELVQQLSREGANATAYPCDVANEEEVRTALDQCRAKYPPIRGVVQGAMVLQVC